MKKLNLLVFVLAIMTLSSCSVITGIFKAGAFVGILAVVIVIGVIIWILSMFRGK
ncbi:MAG: phosphatidate cytidylyltransferase [Mucilaginibacter sp.]